MFVHRGFSKCTATLTLALATLLSVQQSNSSAQRAGDRFRRLPAGWAGDWDTVDMLDPLFAGKYKTDPPFNQADPMIKADLTPAATRRMEATDYDTAPGSLCDPEGWFPFINYGYGFALLDAPGKIVFVPVEPDTEGIRRVYLKPHHAARVALTWDGDSIAHWDGDTLVVDTTGFNDKSWLGDDRERHSTGLHMTERLSLVANGQYLQIQYEISDPEALKAPYHLVRYFRKYTAKHIGAGPDRDTAELVCNEDPSPFKLEKSTQSK